MEFTKFLAVFVLVTLSSGTYSVDYDLRCYVVEKGTVDFSGKNYAEISLKNVPGSVKPSEVYKKVKPYCEEDLPNKKFALYENLGGKQPWHFTKIASEGVSQPKELNNK